MSSDDEVSPRELLAAIEAAEKRRCETCEFSQAILAKGPNGEAIIGQTQLVCMRHPPMLLMKTIRSPLGESDMVISMFPPVGEKSNIPYCYDYWPEDEPLPIAENFDLITGNKMDS